MAMHNIVDFGSIKEITSHAFMSEPEISSIKETLKAQQKLLQKLYNELEAEREASETAANEALSVILRLQGEKAAIKMEAEQYRRLSEDRMGQMEDSLTIMQELIYHKEMEVAALDHQVQAYRCKLLNMGYIDNEGLIEEKGSSLRELCNNASDFDYFASEGAVDHSYWDMIEGLGSRVRGIVGVDYPRSSSPRLSRSSASSASSIQSAVSNQQAENIRSVHDVFEVPQVEKSLVIVSHKPSKERGKETSTCCEENICGSVKNVALVQPRRSDRRNIITSEIERVDGSDGSSNREEQLILLKQIKEQVSSLHDEVRRLKANQSAIIREEQSMDALREAMLYFWL